MRDIDVIVVGGGLVGLAIAYGLLCQGQRVTVFDEGDEAFRASRGNFGHVWVQGKGANNIPYARWSLLAAQAWPAFAAELIERTGVDPQLEQPGAVMLALNEGELQGRADKMKAMRGEMAALGIDYPYEILEPAALRRICPAVGPEVLGACFSPMDGQVNPLKLLRALTAAVLALGGEIRTGQRVCRLEPRGGAFEVTAGATRCGAGKLVLAAGLGNAALAPMVGLHAPVWPVRGQLVITERLQRFLPIVTGSVRQTDDGYVQIGESMEDVGLDEGTTTDHLSRITGRAIRMFPLLAGVNVVRTWGALRIMTADGYPIYQTSSSCPGAFLVTCHSGVTLASQHAAAVADWVRTGVEPVLIAGFKAERAALAQDFSLERFGV
jgi:glycine/D-amino acid oxidase-like deaminating enzyme